jgi:hypothetical protein
MTAQVLCGVELAGFDQFRDAMGHDTLTGWKKWLKQECDVGHGNAP